MRPSCWRQCSADNNPPAGPGVNTSAYVANESGLAGAMALRWASFAASGNPNVPFDTSEVEPAWPGCPAPTRAAAAPWPLYHGGSGGGGEKEESDGAAPAAAVADAYLRLDLCDISSEVSAGRGPECDFWDRLPANLPPPAGPAPPPQPP